MGGIKRRWLFVHVPREEEEEEGTRRSPRMRKWQLGTSENGCEVCFCTYSPANFAYIKCVVLAYIPAYIALSTKFTFI